MTEETVSERARERRVIYPRGKSTVATPEHFRIAKLLYEGRPFVMGSTPTTQGASVGKAFDWDGAPAYYQTDLLELAHFVVEGQRTITSASPALEAVKDALEPVWHWYQSDEHPERPLHEVVADVVADLQQDRAWVLNPPKHKFWMAGEPDCPREIKAGNGELHTLRCKVCGKDNPRDDFCRAPAPAEDSGVVGMGHDEAIVALADCAATVTVLSYREAIEGYFRLRGIAVP